MSGTARQKRNLANLQAKWKIFTATPLRWLLSRTHMSLEGEGGTGDVRVAWSWAWNTEGGHPGSRLGPVLNEFGSTPSLGHISSFVR